MKVAKGRTVDLREDHDQEATHLGEGNNGEMTSSRKEIVATIDKVTDLEMMIVVKGTTSGEGASINPTITEIPPPNDIVHLLNVVEIHRHQDADGIHRQDVELHPQNAAEASPRNGEKVHRLNAAGLRHQNEIDLHRAMKNRVIVIHLRPRHSPAENQIPADPRRAAVAVVPRPALTHKNRR